MAKYEYIFVRLDYGFSEPDYKKEVENYAHQGWRLVQIFAYRHRFWGIITHFQLIFEREINASV